MWIISKLKRKILREVTQVLFINLCFEDTSLKKNAITLELVSPLLCSNVKEEISPTRG